MKVIGIAAFALLASAGIVQAQVATQSWVIFEERAGRLTAYDAGSVRTIGNHRRGWYILVNAETNEFGADYSLSNFDMDCDDETFQLRSIATFRIDGESVSAFQAPDDVLPIVPGSGGRLLFEAVCNGTEIGEPVRLSPADFATVIRDILNDPE